MLWSRLRRNGLCRAAAAARTAAICDTAEPRAGSNHPYGGVRGSKGR